MSNKVYDALKWLAQIGLPGLGTLYFALAQIWSLPFGSEVVGSITAVDAFLGFSLGLSTKAYNKSDAPYDGTMNVVELADGRQTYSLELNGDPGELPGKDSVSFKVAKP